MNRKYLIKQISAILHSWNPIGLTPDDEYDDLSIKIVKRIDEGDSKEQVIKFVDHYLKNIVGLSKVNKSDLHTHISAIFRESDKFKKMDN